MLIEAMMLSAAVRVGLKLLPVRTVRRWTGRLGARSVRPRDDDGLSVERIVWAVRVATRRLPGTTCLVQAMTGHVLLRRRGIPASVRIGVTKDRVEGFQAHAWLESEGEVLIGGSDRSVGRYEPLAVLEE